MSVQIPTTAQLAANITAQMQASLNTSFLPLPKSFIAVLAKALAGVFILLYKYLGFGILQQFVRFASTESTNVNGVVLVPLVELGRQFGVGDPAEATQAQLLVDVTVATQVGVLPSSSQLVNGSTGVTYLTVGEVALDAAVVQATVRAASDQTGGQGAGVIGNLTNGATLSFVSPLANVNQVVTVVAQVVTGADGESWAAYRQRILDSLQKRKQGGALADYEQWGEEPAGILNIFPYTSDCPGQVDVYVEATPASAGNADGIPTTAQLQEALDSIQLDESGLATRRPVGALVNTFPIRRTAFDVAIMGLTVDNPTTVLAQVQSALDEYFFKREPFIIGLSVGAKRNSITQPGVAGTVDDIVTASGGIFSSVEVSTSSTGSLQTYFLGVGEKAKLGALSNI